MYKRKSREIIMSLLRRISSVGDTYEQHKENVDYNSFLEIQLEIVKRIITTEKRISKLRNERLKNLKKIEETLERRRLLKLLGTTISWMILEFDRSYICNFARGQDSGFISGKKGLKLELLALKSAFRVKDHAAILHDITNCLRTGDLSVTGPKGVLTLELKLTKRKKMDRRERRQKRRGEIIREFYDKGISTKIIPGMKSIRLHSERRDRHNWNDVSAVIKEALENDNGVRVVEKCLIYAAFKDIIPNDKLNDLVFDHIKLFKDPIFMLGCHDRHIVGLPQTLPFTCFEIPLSYKEELLFREVNFCVMLDLNSLSRIMEENGFHCRVLKDSDTGVLEVTDIENQSLDLQLLVMV